jgi:hypothetical protein
MLSRSAAPDESKDLRLFLGFASVALGSSTNTSAITHPLRIDFGVSTKRQRAPIETPTMDASPPARPLCRRNARGPAFQSRVPA